MYISLKDGRPKMLYTVQDTIPRCTCTHWPLRTLSCTLLFVPSHIPLLTHVTLSHTTPHTVTLSHTTLTLSHSHTTLTLSHSHTTLTLTLSHTTPHTPSHSYTTPHTLSLSHTTPHTSSHSHIPLLTHHHTHIPLLTHHHSHTPSHIPLLTPSLISAMLDILDWMFWDVHFIHVITLTPSHPHTFTSSLTRSKSLTDAELEQELGITNTLHRMKLRLALQEVLSITTNTKLYRTVHLYICSERQLEVVML